MDYRGCRSVVPGGLALPARADDAADCAGGAVAACQRQADSGAAISQKLLGSMYAAGEGVARDYLRAYLWLSLAIAEAKALAALWNPTR